MEMKNITSRLTLGLLWTFFSWSDVQTTDASWGSVTGLLQSIPDNWVSLFRIC